MRFFIHLAYQGSNYSGWQRQKNTKNSVQQVLEETIKKMTGQQLSVMGCGRTDAGVHAMQYFAHFDYDKEWQYDPVERLNRMLPNDISVYELIPVENKAHSRYDAKSRSYEYYIHTECNPYLSPVSTYIGIKNIDMDQIKKGLEFIKNLQDFRHVCLTPDRNKNTFCCIYEAEIKVSNEGKLICFRFTANRFLKSMIRIIVARLLELGERKISMQVFEDINLGKIKLKYQTMAYPQGLHLSKIVYPYLQRDTKETFFNI